ncbi:M14 family zinc carboxypeptidase [Mycolicibacterium iranicum]|uniref:DUF2817 domain-containing protein n=1 Tax=Mycolicibacterium iranicum TaxID=912594 RepID=A0ABT4HLZ8_MYCIR|nr:M14 family zinc carboxypeptidase [Mycolicibacterium iranicum]MCZ0731247.1 DUF2817 domain-containing protein [Mycolicibacterium iranicum]
MLSGCSAENADRATASPPTSIGKAPPTTPTPPQQLAPADPANWQIIGTSVNGLPIRQLTVGRGPRQVLFIGGIHGDETEGVVTAAELPAAIAASSLNDLVTLTIIEDANPDGRAAGTRENANAVDVNRNFPASNFDLGNPVNGYEPLSQPESRAVVAAIDRIVPALVIVAHSWSGRQFINFDGPARELADRFAATSGFSVEESNSFAATPGSLGSYAGRDRGIPVLTVEVLRGSDPRAVWNTLRPALLEAISG